LNNGELDERLLRVFDVDEIGDFVGCIPFRKSLKKNEIELVSIY